MTQNVPWDPTDTNVARILEMIMFHDAAGGQAYTGLTHRFQNRLETSDHLALGQAILVAELPQPAADLLIDGIPIGDRADQPYSVLRMFLPVEVVASKQ